MLTYLIDSIQESEAHTMLHVHLRAPHGMGDTVLDRTEHMNPYDYLVHCRTQLSHYCDLFEFDYTEEMVFIGNEGMQTLIDVQFFDRASRYRTSSGNYIIPRNLFFDWLNYATFAAWFNDLGYGFKIAFKRKESLLPA